MATTPVYAFRYRLLGDSPDIAAGTQNLAEDVENKIITMDALWTKFARKTSDESVASSTVLQDDDHLFIPYEVGIWVWSAMLIYTGAATGFPSDLKLAWTFNTASTSVLHWSGIGYHELWSNSSSTVEFNATAIQNQTVSPTASQPFGSGSGVNQGAHIKGLLVANAAGTLRLQWAQQTADGTATVIKAGSYLEMAKRG